MAKCHKLFNVKNDASIYNRKTMPLDAPHFNSVLLKWIKWIRNGVCSIKSFNIQITMNVLDRLTIANLYKLTDSIMVKIDNDNPKGPCTSQLLYLEGKSFQYTSVASLVNDFI